MSDLFVYEIRLVGTDRVYVGSTSRGKRRFSEHRSELRSGKHCNPPLQNAWAKYGPAAFTFTVLEHLADVEAIIAREQYWIDLLAAATTGFNLCPAAGTRRGVAFTTEHKAKISAAKMGHKVAESTRTLIQAARAKQIITPESIVRTRTGNLGQMRSAAFAEGVSARMKGRPKSAEHIAKLRAANIGKKHSPETHAKQSVAATGRVKSPGHCAALSAALTGKKLSPETIAKRQATRRANALTKN